MANRCLRLIRNRNRSTTRKISVRVGYWARVPIKRDRRQRLFSTVVSLKRNCHTSPPRTRFLLVKLRIDTWLACSCAPPVLVGCCWLSRAQMTTKVYSRGLLRQSLGVFPEPATALFWKFTAGRGLRPPLVDWSKRQFALGLEIWPPSGSLSQHIKM
jgi:hypothetical protein